MIYGQDAPIAFPVADLYDSGMMQMYVQAARDLYQQGLRDYENFVAKYGDFSSPFKNDVDAWNNEIMGPTVNMIEAMYAQGIDPTRNAEARAMISRAMRTIPYEKAAIMRQNAKAGEEYLKARGALAAKGLYDKDYNDFWLREQGYTPFEEWDSSKGVWNITSPVEYKSLFDATNPWFKNLKPHELTKQQVIDAKHPYDPNYIYTGIPIDDLRAVTAAGIPGFMNSIEGRYYRDYVSKRLAALGIEPTEEAVNAALAEDIVTANHLMTLAPSREADRFAIMDRQAQLNEQQAQRDFNREVQLLEKNNLINNSSGGGYEYEDLDIPLGPADQLESDQRMHMTEKRKQANDEAILKSKQIDAETKRLYSTMSESNKSRARIYEKQMKIKEDKNSSSEDKKKAQNILDHLNKINDGQFSTWRNTYNSKNISGEYIYSTKTTTEGLANYGPQSGQELYDRSHKLFEENNVVDGLTQAQKDAINQSLGYAQSGDDQVGVMSKNKEIGALAITKLTGSRRFANREGKNLFHEIQKLISGKPFTIAPENVVRRKYGAGYINNKQTNVVVDYATFNDPDLDDYLKGFTEESLNGFGIYNTGDGTWTLEIVTKMPHSQGRAHQNTIGDKSSGGTTHSKSHHTTRLARELTQQTIEIFE